MNRNLPFEKLPEKIIPVYKVWHLKNCHLSITNLAQLADSSPHQPVREYARMKLAIVAEFNLHNN